MWPGTPAKLRDKICTDPAKRKQKQLSASGDCVVVIIYSLFSFFDTEVHNYVHQGSLLVSSKLALPF